MESYKTSRMFSLKLENLISWLQKEGRKKWGNRKEKVMTMHCNPMHAAQLVLRAKTSTVFTNIAPKSTKFFLLQKMVYQDL